MSDTKTAYGVCTKIEEANGWTAFLIEQAGMKYPLKLSTKLPKLIEQGRAAGQAACTWTYSEKESDKINENTGRPWTNRYLEGVSMNGDEGVRAQAEQSLGTGVGPFHDPEPPRRPLVGGDKDRAITRMSCLKTAAETYSHGWFDKDVDVGMEVMKLALRYEQWVYRDLTPPPETLRD